MRYNRNKLDEFYRILNPQDKNMIYPVQLSFPGEVKCAEKGLTTKSSRFFEILTQGIYGGGIKVRQNIQKGKNLVDYSVCEPDISSANFYREVKSTSNEDSLKLSDRQIAKYTTLAMQNGDSKKITFEIFVHGLKKLQKNYSNQSLEKLILDLSTSTKYNLSLPFSLVFDLCFSKSKLVSKYLGDCYDKLTRVKKSSLDKFFYYPEETLEYLGKDPEDFEIIKRKFSIENKMNGNVINSFPILIILDKNYESWVKQTRERINQRENLPENFIKEYNLFNGIHLPKESIEENTEDDSYKEQEEFLLRAWNPADDLPF